MPERSVNNFESIDDLADWGAKFRVVYEIDPVLQPGVFVDLVEARPFLETIGERVRIEKVRLPERLLNQRTNDLTFVQEAPVAGPSVTFYPDGSSETADIILVSKDPEDYREMVVHVDGITGGVRSELKAFDDLVPIEWMDDEGAPAPKQAEGTPTISTPARTELSAPTPMPEDPAFDDSNKAETTSTNIFDEDFR